MISKPGFANLRRVDFRHTVALWIFFLWVPMVFSLRMSGAEGKSSSAISGRVPRNNQELRYWLQNMVWYHHFTLDEMQEALGMPKSEIADALKYYRITPATRPSRLSDAPLLVMPYPGGRHPRIGFLDGAVRPQRETKLSVFAPWDEDSYVVIDVPEALWSNLGLTYLAHTHIPTIWSQKGVDLPPLEWRRRRDGSFNIERRLPNGIQFFTQAIPNREAVRLEMKLTNGTTNTLRDLRVQMCAMLKGMEGFQQQTNANKVFGKPFVACKSEDGQRWLIWAWQPCHRAWGNPPVPCLHSDPKFPDCKPGESKTVHGWLSFYEGKDIQKELIRIEQEPWLFQAEGTFQP